MIHSKITPELQTVQMLFLKSNNRLECYKTTVIQCCYVNCYIFYSKKSFIQICEYFIQYFVCKQKINKISLRFVSIFSVFLFTNKNLNKILTNRYETHFQVKNVLTIYITTHKALKTCSSIWCRNVNRAVSIWSMKKEDWWDQKVETMAL